MSLKIALVTPPTKSHRTAEETLALGYLGVILRKAGYEVSIVDGWLEQLSAEEMVEKLAIGGFPAMIGFSCYRSNLDQACEVMNVAKKRFGNIPFICGGYGPTFHDEVFLKSGFVVAVRGEAERSIVNLVDAVLSNGDLSSIPGISFQKEHLIVRTERIEPVTDLDIIDFPARDTIGLAIKHRNFVHMSTSRGCEANCTFCSIIAFDRSGPRKVRWRYRSIRDIIAEIEILNQQYGIKHFKFVDDSFIEAPRDEQWAQELCDELLARNLAIRFRTQIRADRLTPNLTRLLKQAGWFSTSVGVENASRAALKRMGKSASQAQNLAALEMLEQNEIFVQMGMILFDPYTTMEELWENLTFLKAHRWPVNKGVFSEMFAAEGTTFTTTGKRRNLVIADTGNQNYTYSVQDEKSKRMYGMLKSWHRTHSVVYDQVIDPLTAPKVMSDDGYRRAHALFHELQALDVRFFELAMEHVSRTASPSADVDILRGSIKVSTEAYLAVEKGINALYQQQGMRYDAVSNPFLA